MEFRHPTTAVGADVEQEVGLILPGAAVPIGDGRGGWVQQVFPGDMEPIGIQARGEFQRQVNTVALIVLKGAWEQRSADPVAVHEVVVLAGANVNDTAARRGDRCWNC